MKLLMFFALMGMVALGLANLSFTNISAALTLPTLGNPALTTGIVKKDDVGLEYVGASDTVTPTPPAMPMSTVTAIHKNMTTAFWTVYQSGWSSAMLISTQSATETTSVFTTSTFNDTIPTLTGVTSITQSPTLMTTDGNQLIFTVTTNYEGTFTVTAPEGLLYWATSSSDVNTQTHWPWPHLVTKTYTTWTSTTTTLSPTPSTSA
ncbi:hypothetical protein HDK77DRAFT_76156 [Phyllosticta capitalensis]